MALPAVVLFVLELPNPKTLGVRYLLPSLALWAVVASPIALLIGRRLVAAALGLLLAVGAGELVSSYPHSIANTAAPFRPAYRVATDSNVDWGQDLGALMAWSPAHHPYVAYFGPRGVTVGDIPDARALVGRAPQEITGWVAASASDLTSADRSALAWLRAYCPVGTLGGSILLYHFVSPPSGAAVRPRRRHCVPGARATGWSEDEGCQPWLTNGLVAPEDVATYFGAVEWLLDVLGRGRSGAGVARASALTRYSTGGVAAHAVQGGILRLEQLLLEPEPTGTRRVDIPEFFGPNRMASVDDDDPLFVLLRAGAEDGAGAGPAALLEMARRSVAQLAELLPATPADRAIPLVRVPDGQVPLSEYLRTRVLEVVVHGDDVVASIDGWHPPDPPLRWRSTSA